MRTCPSCGRANPENRDFCPCGEYLRWEPTQTVQTLDPASGLRRGPASAAPPDPELTLPPTSSAGNSGSATTDDRPVGAGSPSALATVLLRSPGQENPGEAPVELTVKPGGRSVVLALIRNEGSIVDNYDVSVRGLPDGWSSVTPATVYLQPIGPDGSYEQEVQVQLHPPRSPTARAQAIQFEVVAASRAHQRDAASATGTLHVEPYEELAAKLAPDRASGRLKARFLLTIRNRANSPLQVQLSAEDADGECQFRFADPAATIEPGQGVEAPFMVLPPKQIWIGRPKDRPIRVTASPVGSAQPQTLAAIYRQRPWFPWWLSLVVPLLAGLVAVALLLLPKQTVVPNLHARTIFAAEKLLTTAGLKLSAQVNQAKDSNVPVGSIIDQTPAPGKKVRRGTSVTVEVAVGSSMVSVPSVLGTTPATADQTLRAAGLVLGTISPQPPNVNAQIASQIPAAQVSVAAGTPVAVFLKPSGAAKGSTSAGGGGTGTGSAANAAAAAAKAIAVPTVSGAVLTAAAQLSQAGLVPKETRQFASSPVGTVIGTNPAAGSSVQTGRNVELLVSAGYPELAYDDGTTIHVIDGASGKTTVTMPTASQPQGEASWNIAGTQLVYVQGPPDAGQLWTFSPNRQGSQPQPLTTTGNADHVPAFAPTQQANVIAFVSGNSSQNLCFGVVGPYALNPDCTQHPGWDLGRQVAWSPDGTKILVFGSQVGHPDVFGLIEFVSNVAFSAHAADWGTGTVVTDTSHAGQGVIAGAFSPDGTKLALISNAGTSSFHVFLTSPTDFMLRRAEALPVSGCQLSWRSDGKELAVVQPQGSCSSNTLGDIKRFDLNDPGTTSTIATSAAYPAWQPLRLNG